MVLIVHKTICRSLESPTWGKTKLGSRKAVVTALFS